MTQPMNIPFGMADIIIDEGTDNEVRFDGKEELQHEGGEFSLTPMFQEIQLADFGESVFDEILTGFEGEVSLTAGMQSLKMLQLAMQATEEITDAEGGDTVGLMDAKIGTSARAKARKVTIHPRQMGDDKSLDIHIYKMASTGEFSRSYANEQGNIPITFKMYPRDGMDANSPGNFFYIGETDPNAE